jgi:DNA-binding transcriptional MocR family regulator
MALLFDASLDSKTKLTAAALAQHMNKNHHIAWPSQQRLSAMTGLSESSIKRAVKILESEGWLTIEHGGLNKGTNQYMPTFPTDIEKQLGHCDPNRGQGDPRTEVTVTSHRGQGDLPQGSQRPLNQSIESVHRISPGADAPSQVTLTKKEKQAIQAELDALIAKQRVRQ